MAEPRVRIARLTLRCHPAGRGAAAELGERLRAELAATPLRPAAGAARIRLQVAPGGDAQALAARIAAKLREVLR